MRNQSTRVALRISLFYLFVAGLWIALSDRALTFITTDPETMNRLATLKGWCFVAFTAVLVFAALRSRLQRLEREAERRRQAEEHVLILNEDLRLRNAEVNAERQRWQGVVEGIADEVWVCDREGRMGLMNLRTVTAMGLTEFKDKSVEEVLEEVEMLNPDGQPRPPEQAPLLRSLQGEIVRGEEIMRHLRTGTTRYRQFSSAPTRDAEGAITGAVAIIRDVTDQKETEEALRVNEAIVDAFFDASPGILNIEDDQFRYIKTDRLTPTYFGLDRQTIVGKALADLAPEFVETVGPMMRRVIETGKPELNVEVGGPVPARPGEMTYWLASYFPVPLPRAGRGIGVMGVEITAQKKAEKTTKESEQRFRALVAASSNVLYRMNADWSEMIQVSGGGFIPDTEAPGRGWLDRYIHQDDRPYVTKAIDDAIRNRSTFELEHRVVRVDGTVGWMFSRAVPILDGNGDLVEWFGAASDITDRKEMEAELRRSHDELEIRVKERTKELAKAYGVLRDEMEQREKMENQLRQSQRMEVVGTLSGGIAHNFNNILAAIVGFAELLKDTLDRMPKERRYAERVFEAAVRGRDVVKGLLAFSRQMEHKKQKVLMGSLVKETLKLLRASLPTTISIELDMRDIGTFVMADPVHVQQILMNLSTNAAYAMREKGGTIVVGLATVEADDKSGDVNLESGRYVKLWVKDTGVGMAEGTKKRIFDPFFTTKAPGEGTGLGLSTVLGIVQGHGGAITVDTQPGAGSTFSVYLPALDVTRGQEAETGEDVPTGKGHVLLVDDEEGLIEMGREILEGLGYEVTATTSSTKALALFLSDPDSFDVVITDQTMPDLTGLDLAKQLMDTRADVPILMVTGFSHLVDADKAQMAGIRAFLMKPLTKGELARTLRDVLSVEERGSKPGEQRK